MSASGGACEGGRGSGLGFLFVLPLAIVALVEVDPDVDASVPFFAGKGGNGLGPLLCLLILLTALGRGSQGSGCAGLLSPPVPSALLVPASLSSIGDCGREASDP